jgi:hypothetical protein
MTLNVLPLIKTYILEELLMVIPSRVVAPVFARDFRRLLVRVKEKLRCKG